MSMIMTIKKVFSDTDTTKNGLLVTNYRPSLVDGRNHNKMQWINRYEIFDRNDAKFLQW